MVTTFTYVTELSTNGTVLGTFAVGTNPSGIAFDGANLWVANEGSDTVTKLLASSGVTPGNLPGRKCTPWRGL